MAEKMYELTIADKQHNPLLTNAKHMVGNNFHVSNIRLFKGKWTRVNEWWFLKNKDLIKKYVDQGQILVKMPDGSMLGSAKPAAAMIPEVAPDLSQVVAMAAEAVFLRPSLKEAMQAPSQTRELIQEEVIVEDDFSDMPLKVGKVDRLKEITKTYAGIIQLDVAGLVEQAHLTPAQAEKVLDYARNKVG